ncbi:hypothetical protein CPB83DRAFT_391423 [Crepidotus variabilis]|uniref:Uncharacterized protein n=1 Tax=Crepidotus variabilis TaxID=179855 RepID=A0A9P6EDR1_9AGAR|nr:hypothetical protein CPB83DRAFT_391423 [Crepidotus variabilis]
MASMLALVGSQTLTETQATSTAGSSSSPHSARNATQRRIFVGPMPERVIANKEGQIRKAKSSTALGSVFSLSLDAGDKTQPESDKSEEVVRLLKENAYRSFLNRGGNAEDWKEDEDQDVVDELVQRWRESEWGQHWRHRHQNTTGQGLNQWFGTSFEIGTLMGVDIVQAESHVTKMGTRSTKLDGTGLRRSSASEAQSLSPTTGQETFVSALSTFGQASGIDIEVTGVSPSEDKDNPTPASSRTGLLPTQIPGRPDTVQKAKSDVPLRPSIHQGVSLLSAQSDGHLLSNKGKARVHYVDLPEVPGPSTPGPAPPEEVLERTQETVDPNTSLAATFTPDLKSPTPSEFRWGDIVLRGDYTFFRLPYKV